LEFHSRNIAVATAAVAITSYYFSYFSLLLLLLAITETSKVIFFSTSEGDNFYDFVTNNFCPRQ
jgi:hypothetical protein